MEKKPEHSHLDLAKIAMAKLIDGRRDSTTKITSALGDVSEKIQSITNELDGERKLRASFECQSQDLSNKLNEIQRKYAELHKGFVKVLTSKFPGESPLSIEARMEAILLASNSGSELGIKPKLASPQATAFLNLIEDSLT
jgi:chromosome segregation ATPase